MALAATRNMMIVCHCSARSSAAAPPYGSISQKNVSKPVRFARILASRHPRTTAHAHRDTQPCTKRRAARALQNRHKNIEREKFSELACLILLNESR